jgi:hypothetical protein
VIRGHVSAQRSLQATVRSATSGFTWGRAQRIPVRIPTLVSLTSITSVVALSTLPLPRG